MKSGYTNLLRNNAVTVRHGSRNDPGDKIHNCVVANVRRVAGQIRASEPVLKETVQRKGLRVVAADYALDTGKVSLLDEAPQ